MTAQEFNAIKSFDEKVNIIWDCSRHVDERIMLNEYKIQMYALYGFYVEVWVGIKNHKIQKIKALQGDLDWKNYLESVTLQDLY